MTARHFRMPPRWALARPGTESLVSACWFDSAHSLDSTAPAVFRTRADARHAAKKYGNGVRPVLVVARYEVML